MAQVTLKICDQCRRQALRAFMVGGHASRMLCPRCALEYASDSIRANERVALEPVEPTEFDSKVVMMSRTRR